MDSCRSFIDSALPASRIGSNPQWKLIASISVRLNNEPTNYRIMQLSSNSVDIFKLLTINLMFLHDHLYISSIYLLCILILLYRNRIIINKAIILLR